MTATPDIVPDSERRGFIGALPPRLRPFASLMRLDLFTCPSPAECDSFDVEGKPLRFDGLHYRGPAALAVSRWILDQIVQPPPA